MNLEFDLLDILNDYSQHRTDKKKYDGQRKTKINKITWI